MRPNYWRWMTDRIERHVLKEQSVGNPTRSTSSGTSRLAACSTRWGQNRALVRVVCILRGTCEWRRPRLAGGLRRLRAVAWKRLGFWVSVEAIEEIVDDVFIQVGATLTVWAWDGRIEAECDSAAELSGTETFQQPSGGTPRALAGTVDGFEEGGDGLSFGLFVGLIEGGATSLFLANGGGANTHVSCGLARGVASGEKAEIDLLFHVVEDLRSTGARHGRVGVRGSANAEGGMAVGRRTKDEG
jgi:hypothetical protein